MHGLNRVVAGMIIAGLATAMSAFAGPPKIGAKVENFTLVDVHEKEATSLTDFEEAKLFVLMFVSTQCPVSNAYNERMAKLYKDFEEKGVQFIGINSNEKEAFGDVKEHADKHKLEFPILKDTDNVIADKFEAKVTPEVYVLEPKQNGGMPDFLLRYHGAIDDNQNESKVESLYLKTTLDALLAGESVPKKETKAFGCAIARVKKQKAPIATP